MKLATIPSAHLKFLDQCVRWEAHEIPRHWSHRKPRVVPPAMTPERARALLRGNSALVTEQEEV